MLSFIIATHVCGIPAPRRDSYIRFYESMNVLDSVVIDQFKYLPCSSASERPSGTLPTRLCFQDALRRIDQGKDSAGLPNCFAIALVL